MKKNTAGSTSTSFNLAISAGLTYFWRVDAMNILGLQTGDVWSFTTGYRPPKEKVAYFPMDETEGIKATNEVEGEATAYNFTPSWQQGIVNNAVMISGTSTNAALVQPHYDALLLNNESFSVEMWFKSSGGAVDWYLFHKGSHVKNATSGSTGKWFGVQYNKTGSNDRLTWAFDDDVTKTDLNVTPGSVYFDNHWHHLVTVRDIELKQSRIYIDGVLKNSRTDNTTSGIGQTEHLVLGNTNNPNAQPTNAFLGMMDEFSIYKGVLSDDEIRANYSAGLVSGFDSPVSTTVRVSPNPFHDYLLLEVGEITSDVQIAISDICGRIVYRTTLQPNERVIEIRTPITLPAGVYVLSITNPRGQSHIKLLKK